MRLTMQHYYRTPNGRALCGAGDWDALRTTDSPFRLPADAEDWESMVESWPACGRRASAIARVARTIGAERVVSYGVGSAILEYTLGAQVTELVCTDFAPATVARLRELGVDARVHDLARDDPLPADLHVLHRVDTEFDDPTLATVLGKFREPALLVVAELLSLTGVVREIVTRARRGSPVGWTRNRSALEACLPPTSHVSELRVGELPGFLIGPGSPL